jgi:membrane associated rhomboid family serine protease
MYFGRVGGIPPVVKNIIIINVIMSIATVVFYYGLQIDLNAILGLYYFKSEYFKPFQFVTYMFMHAMITARGGFMHIFFNMFALWMFGKVLESVWGSKRFLIYYMVTGLGAALIQTIVNYVESSVLISHMSSEQISLVYEQGYALWQEGKTFSDPQMAKLCGFLNIPVIGASGAVFGILLAFGMLFPNTEMIFIFFPMPIKAKYMVILYGVIELTMGIGNFKFDNVAHFAHLGGMLFGFILIKYWQKTTKSFY